MSKLSVDQLLRPSLFCQSPLLVFSRNHWKGPSAKAWLHSILQSKEINYWYPSIQPGLGGSYQIIPKAVIILLTPESWHTVLGSFLKPCLRTWQWVSLLCVNKILRLKKKRFLLNHCGFLQVMGTLNPSYTHSYGKCSPCLLGN